VCSIFYSATALPPEEILSRDLKRFLALYRHLVDTDSTLFLRVDPEDDEVGLEPENLKRLREHKRIERNRRLASKVKKVQGYTCKACGFNFEKAYGQLGRVSLKRTI